MQGIEKGGDQRIVVGVDGSASSRRALAWAARHASLTRLPVLAVLAFHPSPRYEWAIGGQDPKAMESEGRRRLEEAVAEALVDQPDVEIDIAVVKGRPVDVLTELSANASLIVVGTRNHHELAGLLLGSVSEHLVARAHCPLVVVRPPSEPVVSPPSAAAPHQA
jgi:nucleotide-binding universal stress UspA family protein